jgi:TolB-like protein/Flp pilus assembly protein TadD
MPSLIPGYEYDIFISYRQKDNKHDGWVTEFVENLKGELESTFKEEISVYFDINPHDGLLETHDVDESLKEKLKCLVFIPIISRTYCDPKAFAWEYEFKAFVEQASNDQFGLKVKLPNGNVASRVLPIQIHDLDNEDITLCESVLGGVLRGIEFIYKEPGVNKPLTDDDDDRKNLNKTKYRIQINKVANSIKEIITGIRQFEEKPVEVSKNEAQAAQILNKNNRLKLVTGSAAAIILIVLGIIFLPKLLNPEDGIEKSIAVLPFIDDSPDENNSHIINGLMEEILINLQRVRDLNVISRNSVEQYRGEMKPTTPEIARKLGVNYIVEGSGQKYGDNLRLRVQLIVISKGKEKHLWGKVYEKEITQPEDYFNIQSEVAESIAGELHAVITPDEENIIDAKPTTDLTAYDFYLRGKDYQKRSYQEEDMRYAVQMYQKAVDIDPGFVLAWVGLAACSRSLFWFSHDKSEENLSRTKEYLDEALSLSPKLKEVRFEEARYYYHCQRDYLKSLQILEELKAEYPEDADIYLWIGYLYRRMGEFRKSLEYNNHAISLEPSDWDKWSNASGTYSVLRNYLDAEKYMKKAADLNPSNSGSYGDLTDLYINSGQLEKAKEFLINNEKSFDPFDIDAIRARLEFLNRNYEEAIKITQTLKKIEFSTQNFYDTKHLKLGIMYRANSNDDLAKRNFSIARDTILKKINKSKNDQRLYMALGIACAGMGLKEEALEAGKKALEILDFTKDAHGGADPEMNMVRILVIVGNFNEAMNRLERVIEHSGRIISVEILKLDPFWDPVRNNAKFQEIINNPEYQIEL